MTKQLNEGFQKFSYWNEYKSKVETKNLGNNNVTRFPIDAFFQGVSKLYVLAYDNTTVDNNDGFNRVKRNSQRKYFLPRVDITNYDVLIDSRNFYGQPTNDLIKQYDEIRKSATGKGDGYATGCLLDYQYLKNHYKIIPADLSEEKQVDADPRSIQETEFYGMLQTNSQVCTVLEKKQRGSI